MTNKEIKEKEDLQSILSDNTVLLRFLELHIIDLTENIGTKVFEEKTDRDRELIKIEAIGELRKLLSDEEPQEE